MSIASKITARVAERMNQQLGYRGDLYLADWQTITANTAKVLIGFDRHLGIPEGEDLRGFFIKNFEGRVLPKMESANVFADEGGLMVIASLYTPTRKLEDKATMVPIVADVRYMDSVMTETWEVKDGIDGEKYLARVSADNIGEILKARRNRMEIKSNKLTLATVMGSGSKYISVGDLVKVVVDDKIIMGAEVTGVSGNTIRVKHGKTAHSVIKEAVIEVLQENAGGKGSEKKKVQDYFTDAFGFKDYAKELTRDSGSKE